MKAHTNPLRSPLFALALTLLAGGSWLACGGDGPEEHGTASSAEVAPVEVRLVELQPETIARSIEASGSLAALRRVSPGTKILGRVARVAVEEGQRVRRGELLAQLEDRDLRAAVSQAEAGIAMAEARLENARAQRDRMRDLRARGSVTEKNLEDAVAAHRVAEAGLTGARADLDAARVMLGYAEIRSPLDGWVVSRRIEAGDMATPGSPLFTIEDLSSVEALVEVPEAAVVGLSEGDEATVEVLGRNRDARVTRIVPAGDPGSRTFTVKLELDNADGTLKSGMFARARFAAGEREALAVAASALVRRGQLEGIYVADPPGDGGPGRLRLRWIKTGGPVGGAGSADGRIEVLSGAAAGERYVLDPAPGLSDGRPYTEVR